MQIYFLFFLTLKYSTGFVNFPFVNTKSIRKRGDSKVPALLSAPPLLNQHLYLHFSIHSCGKPSPSSYR